MVPTVRMVLRYYSNGIRHDAEKNSSLSIRLGLHLKKPD